MIIAELADIKKYFPPVKAVDGVSLKIEKGKTLGLVGESGSGKTTLGKIMLGIIKPDSGQADISAKRMQAIFQDPHSSLDPKMRVADILAEGLVLEGMKGPSVSQRLAAALELVKLPKTSLLKYPHQFSGGERQRIAIARAVITEPELVVCDEPVSSLDVTIQVQILDLLKSIQKKLSITYLFISHDLRVIRFMADSVAVMKDGKIVEEGDVDKVYTSPRHPYTKALLLAAKDISW